MSWFKSYLTGRYQRVVLDGVSSNWRKVTSGVPQGSILGPFLFLLYINDLPNVLSHSTPLLFADDTKVYRKIKSVCDCVLLQEDINALYNWCSQWKLEFNVSKCKVLRVTKNLNPINFNYFINGCKLETVSEFKDLGIIVKNDLSWNNNTKSITSKAIRMLGLIKRTIGYRAPQNVKLQLYLSLVRSNLEYCTQSWNGLTKQNRIKIERVQRVATRYILNYPDMSYTERLLKLNILPLSFRRDILDLKFFYKCFVGKYCLNVRKYLQFTCEHYNRNTRFSSDPYLIKYPFCKTKTFRNSYFNRIIYSWNRLPLKIRSSNNINALNASLKDYFRKFVPMFRHECCCCLYYNCECLN